MHFSFGARKNHFCMGDIVQLRCAGYYGSSDRVHAVLCPVYGEWRFSYSDSLASSESCTSAASRASTCSSGSALELQFRGCGFPDRQERFK